MTFQNEDIRYMLPDLLCGRLPEKQRAQLQHRLASDEALLREYRALEAIVRSIDRANLPEKYEREAGGIAEAVLQRLRQTAEEEQAVLHLLPDYVMGRLDPKERRKVERVLQHSATLQRELEAIRATTQLIAESKINAKYEREAQALSVLVVEQLQQQPPWWRFRRWRWQWVIAAVTVVVGMLTLAQWFLRTLPTESGGAKFVQQQAVEAEPGLLETPVPIFTEIWYEDLFQQPEMMEQFLEVWSAEMGEEGGNAFPLLDSNMLFNVTTDDFQEQPAM